MNVDDHDVDDDDDGGVHHDSIFWNGSQMHFLFREEYCIAWSVYVCFIDA